MQEQQKPVFVKQYTLVDPKALMIDYTLFFGRKYIPVAYEEHSRKEAFHSTVMLPTSMFAQYLTDLNDAPADVSAIAKNRTISIITLNNEQKIYMIPDLIGNEKVNTYYTKHELPMAFNVTPEINRAIIEQYKIYTR